MIRAEMSWADSRFDLECLGLIQGLSLMMLKCRVILTIVSGSRNVTKCYEDAVRALKWTICPEMKVIDLG